MNYITYGIIIITAIISVIGFNNTSFLRKSMFSTYEIIKKKEIFRIISSQFIHADWAHLLFNMVSFYFFAINIENKFGPAAVFIIYFVSAIGGDLFVLFLKRRQNYQSLGASGAVSGIIFASVFLSPNSKIIIFPLPFPIPPWLYAILFILISIIAIGRKNQNISHESHIGGAFSGLLTTFILYKSLVFKQLSLAIFLFVVIIIFFVIKGLIQTDNQGHM